MDKWEDYPIKVLDMLPLIMVTLPIVSSFSSGGVVAGPRRPPPLVVASLDSSDPSCEWSLSSPTSLACGRPPWRMALSLCVCERRRIHVLRVASSSRSRNGGSNQHRDGSGRLAWADRPKPISARLGHPFAHVDLLAILHFAPFTCIILATSSSHPRWRVFSLEVRSFALQSSGMLLCNTSVLATFGSDFIMLSNTKKTPHLLLWTCCDSVLFVHVFLQKHNTSKCADKDELVISLVCLVAG
jgi:hypothetical protein